MFKKLHKHWYEWPITVALCVAVLGIFVFRPAYNNGTWTFNSMISFSGQLVFLCGDGVVGAGEECDDANTSDGDGCSAGCTIEPGYSCVGEPSVCTNACGNGALDSGETCDDGNTSGGDGCDNTCQTEVGYTCSGTPSTCVLECSNGAIDPGEQCDDGNLINGDGCSDSCLEEPGYVCVGVPSVCAETCGDGLVGTSEQCDDGNLVNGDGCSDSCNEESGYTCFGEPSTCTNNCGNGVVNFGEECDDGNLVNGDGCSSICTDEAGPPVCGDGIVNGTDQCDDGAGNSDTIPDACRTDCTLPVCGDAVTDTGEQCDDGNASNTDDCLNSCIISTCGDGYIHQTKEQCEPPGVENVCTDYCTAWIGGGSGNPGPGSSSSQPKVYQSEITRPREGCGNGVVQPEQGEQCDDGANNGQGNCSTSCQLLYCGDLVYSPGLEECEPAPFANPDGSLFYRVPSCGNFCAPPDSTLFNPNEFCTYIEQDPCDGESEIFDQQHCGNGVIDAGEQCDQGSVCEGGAYHGFLLVNDLSIAACYEGGGVPLPVSGDGCSDTCTLELCGDGVVQPRGPDGFAGTADDEQCDNGSVCSDTGLPCTSNSQCNSGAECVYDISANEECNARCKTTQCQYSYRLELPELDPSTHTVRLTVTDSRGISGVDTTIFSISDSLNSMGKLIEEQNPGLLGSLFNGLRLNAQLQGTQLTTTVSTDVTHYLKNRDSHAVISCTVYDENGNPICDLPPDAFALEVDGLPIEDAEFTETDFGYCGDGARQAGEECDDGNTIDTDSCSNTCKQKREEPVEPPAPVESFCPNGRIDPGEQCDDGNQLNGDGCSVDCAIEQYCGDGIVQSGEQCDDGNTLDSDGCSSQCLAEEVVQNYCGDGALDEGEQCDEGSANSATAADACRTNCIPAYCGDGVLDTLEQCDSGANNAYESSTCRPTCMLPVCGDGIVDLGEQCDGGENCSQDCFILSQPICGNGVLEDPETCDDGNIQSGDGCNSVCSTELNLSLINVCGNGKREFGEQCDDGNKNPNDSCSNTCTLLQTTTLRSAPQTLPLATIAPVIQRAQQVPSTGPGLALLIALSTGVGYFVLKSKKNKLSNQSV